MNMRQRLWSTIQSHRAVSHVIAIFLVLAVTYSIATPVFEAGDELWHYPFVQHLATGHGLPIQDPNVKTLWEQEGGQPPLYYVMSALATFWIDTRDLSDRIWLNPHAKIGIPLAFGNKNMVVHTSAESFPWQGTTLAIHLIRFLSIIFSAITVALTYGFALEISRDVFASAERGPVPDAGLEIASGTPPLAGGARAEHPRNDMANKLLAAIAAAIAAFNPMFIFISASVNNDNLATMLATLALVLLAQLVTRGATMRRFIVLGIVLGLGALTKISNLGLLVVAAIVFAYLLWCEWIGRGQAQTSAEKKDLSAFIRVHLRPILLGSFACAAAVVVIAFWWYVRNGMLYDDWFAFNVWVQIAGGRPTPVTLMSLWNEFQGFRISFWGNFGGVNIIAPDWVYTLLDIFSLLALAGLVMGVLRCALPRLLAIPVLWLVLIMLSLVRWTWLTMASQGRLIFPAIAAVAVLMAYGVWQIANSIEHMANGSARIAFYVSRFTLYALPIFLFIFALLAPFTLIAPAYALPARFADESSVPNATRVNFNNQAELVGYALPQKAIKPGDELPITIYWRARETMSEDFSAYIRLLDADGKSIGRWEAFPGNGLYPTRLWQPGEIIEDKYRILVSLDARRPSMARVEVGLFRRVPLETLVARDPQGRTVTPSIARFKVVGQSPAQIENPVDYRFGDQIALVGYSRAENVAPGSTLSVKLFWRALKPIDEDYTVFVHLVDTNGKIIAQKDDQPQRGTYPTSFWDTGETIADEYAFAVPRDAPAGDYRIMVGVYYASDNVRLPVRDRDEVYLAGVRIAK